MNLITKISLFIFFCFGFWSFAQNQKQIDSIKKQTNIEGLKQLQKMFKPQDKNKLKKQAKKAKIPFSGYNPDGSYFELQGFEKDGKPIYYTTFKNTQMPSPSIQQPQISIESPTEKIQNTEKHCKGSQSSK